MAENKKEEQMEIRLSTNNIVTVFLAIVFVVGAFQTLQLVGLSDTISEQGTQIASLKTGSFSAPTGAVVAATQPSAQSAGSVPSNLQSLPDMVGGC